MERSRALLTEKRAAGARLEEELAALREDEVDITAAIRQKQGANAALQARCFGGRTSCRIVICSSDGTSVLCLSQELSACCALRQCASRSQTEQWTVADRTQGACMAIETAAPADSALPLQSQCHVLQWQAPHEVRGCCACRQQAARHHRDVLSCFGS